MRWCPPTRLPVRLFHTTGTTFPNCSILRRSASYSGSPGFKSLRGLYGANWISLTGIVAISGTVFIDRTLSFYCVRLKTRRALPVVCAPSGLTWAHSRRAHLSEHLFTALSVWHQPLFAQFRFRHRDGL